MTDEPLPDPPPSEPSENAGADLISEQELDQILMRASSLADALSQQVGAADQPGERLDVTDKSDEAGGLPSYFENGLNELEDLIATTRNELDKPPDELEEAVESSNGVSQPEKQVVPDFMQELTQSEEPTETAPQPAAPIESTAPAVGPAEQPNQGETTPPDQESKPGVVGTGQLGVVGAPIEKIRSNDNELLETSSGADMSNDVASKVSAATKSLQLVEVAVEKLSPLAMAACARMVNLLEIMDRPFGWLGHSARRLIGWIALATMGTAMVASLVSCF